MHHNFDYGYTYEYMLTTTYAIITLKYQIRMVYIPPNSKCVPYPRTPYLKIIQIHWWNR